MNRNLFVIFTIGLLLPFHPSSRMTPIAYGDVPVRPYSSVHYEQRLTQTPPQKIQVVRIDLRSSGVELRVSAGGTDPDGLGEYQTTLQTLSAIADREHFEVAINGDFFSAQKTVDAEGAQSGYVTGKWAKVSGPAVTDGVMWGPAQEPRPALILDAQKRPRISLVKEVPPNALQVIAGSHIIVMNGKISVEDKPGFVRTRHPRTAVGIADKGRTLVLVVVDGRQENVASGMSLPELAALMVELGCRDALNLDGGGSSELVLRNPENAQLQVMNHPSDGRERAIANGLGVTIRGSKRAPKSEALPH